MSGDRIYLLHMSDAIRRITAYAADGEEAYHRDERTQDAILRNLEVIGEATKHLSDELRDQWPDVPWRRMAGMRDRLIHGYFGVDLDLVWQVVRQHLPDLAVQIGRILEETGSEDRETS